MPNLAMAYRMSVTAFCTNRPGDEKATGIFTLLGKLGKAVMLEESGFDLFTSVFEWACLYPRLHSNIQAEDAGAQLTGSAAR